MLLTNGRFRPARGEESTYELAACAYLWMAWDLRLSWKSRGATLDGADGRREEIRAAAKLSQVTNGRLAVKEWGSDTRSLTARGGWRFNWRNHKTYIHLKRFRSKVLAMKLSLTKTIKILSHSPPPPCHASRCITHSSLPTDRPTVRALPPPPPRTFVYSCPKFPQGRERRLRGHQRISTPSPRHGRSCT